MTIVVVGLNYVVFTLSHGYVTAGLTVQKQDLIPSGWLITLHICTERTDIITREFVLSTYPD